MHIKPAVLKLIDEDDPQLDQAIANNNDGGNPDPLRPRIQRFRQQRGASKIRRVKWHSHQTEDSRGSK